MADSKIEFHPAFAQDLKELKVNQIEFSEIRKKVEADASYMESYAKRLRGLPAQFRKLNVRDKRVVLWHSRDRVYVLKIFHRRQGYSKDSLVKILKLIREYTS